MNSLPLPIAPGGLDAALIDRAAPPGSMRYFSLLFTPAEQRECLAAIYVIEAELRDSSLAGHDVAHVRLQWWREEIERLAETRPQHPATRVLARHRGNAGVDFRVLQQTVTAAAMDLACATFETHSELERYFRHSGALFEIAAQCLIQAPSAQAIECSQQAAQVVRQTETWRDLRRNAREGRLYLPLTALDQANIAHEALAQAEWPAPLLQLLRAQSQRRLSEFQAALDALTHFEKAALRPLIVLACLHGRLMKKMMQMQFVESPRARELSGFDKLWTAWRAARKAS